VTSPSEPPADQGAALEMRLQKLEAELEAAHAEVEAMRRDAERHRTLFDTMAQGVLYQLADGTITAANAAALHILGLDLDDITNRTSLDPRWNTIHEDGSAYPGSEHPTMVALRTGLPVRDAVMGIFNPVENDYRWIKINAVPQFRDGEAKPYQAYVTFEDMTSEHRARVALQESEQLLQQVFDILPIGLWIADAKGRLLSGNPAGIRIWGAEPLVDQGDYGVFKARRLPSGKEIAPDDWALAHTVNEGVTVVDELLEIETFDGYRKVIMNYTAPVLSKDGTVQGAVVVNQDLTETQQAQEENRLLAELVSLSPVSITVHDFEGNFLFANTKTLEMHGYSREEFMELGLRRLDTEESAALAPERMQTIREKGQASFDVTHRRKDGSTIPLHVEVRTISWGGEEAILSMATDISERLRLEREMIELERRLMHTQKLESLGVLAGGLAHDFNNLLMAVIGNLDMALAELSAASPAHTSIEEALQAARGATDLTRQILAYSGRARLEKRIINLSTLVGENADMLRVAVPRNVTLEDDLPADVPPIVGDHSQLQQVVMNLITNAAEAIGTKAGVVRVSTGRADCDEDYLARSRLEEKPSPGGFVWLEVSDTGSGMDEATEERIFEPFFTTKFTGRGLGMSAVLGIIRGHEGALMIDSAPARGTVIRVLFPESAASIAGYLPRAAATESSEAQDRAHAIRGTVLVVDDEEAVRNLCTRMVCHFGFEVRQAANGLEALRAIGAASDEIAAVILDLTMPTMDGLTALSRIRHLKPKLPVILSSGYAREDVTERCAANRPAGFIQKPYRLETLRQELARVLGIDL